MAKTKKLAGTTAATKYRADIDGLRAIAVIAVLCFHAFPDVLPGGFVGVDIFFVLSAYLITQLMIEGSGEGTFRLAAFYARRIKRLFPALLIVFIGVYTFGWFNLLGNEFKALGKHIAAGALSVVNLVLQNESGYFDSAASQKPLLHLWSLGVEEQFYLVWPPVLWVTLRWRQSPIVVACLIGLASFITNIALIGHSPAAAFYSPASRAWELMAGAILAMLHLQKIRFAGEHANAKAVIGAALSVLAIATLDKSTPFPGGWTLLPVIGTCLLIDAGQAAWLNRRVLAHPWMAGVGLISYPLYLFHWPILSFLRIMDIDTPPWKWRAAAILICFPLAWMTYRFIEKPIRSARYSRTKVTVLIVLMALMGFQGYNTYIRDGLSFRMRALAGRLTESKHFDLRTEWREHRCFLSDGESTFSPECVEGGKGPLLLLWGDSHSAAVYPAMRDTHQQYGIRLAQFSAASCPPILGAGCREVEANVVHAVNQTHPDIVVLTANWSVQSISALGPTVEALRQAGVRRIVLLGLTPRWTDHLPKIYWAWWRAHHLVLPEYTTVGLDKSVAQIDHIAEASAKSLGIEYISAYRAMCNKDGCMTRSGPGKGSIAMYDDHHLTPEGAKALIDVIGPALFTLPK